LPKIRNIQLTKQRMHYWSYNVK